MTRRVRTSSAAAVLAAPSRRPSSGDAPQYECATWFMYKRADLTMDVNEQDSGASVLRWTQDNYMRAIASYSCREAK